MPSDPNKAREIFLHAVGKLQPEQWEAYVLEASGGDTELQESVRQLLNVHREAGSFLESPIEPMLATVDEPHAERPGASIGPYKLLEQIGEGGFGIVFMAEQLEPIRRKLALKVLKPGMDTRHVVARFEAERQALAIMDHPHIAKVFDGGTTPSGRPYFVMELVKGTPITEFCDQNQMTPRQRLELFLQVCHAVQHAHQKGIIHRDLKPTNVLVSRHDTTPIVKVIDFGVAKALGQELTDKTLFTGMAQMIGTPLYMSPEQAGMSDLDVDTRSDIYSLGVLLYELLTGTTPFTKDRFKQAAYDEIRRIIREEEPPKPSTRLSDSGKSLASISAQRHMEPAKLTKLVRGELDWIVMKALEKDRARRYETANGFAMDIQRYLADEPVLACPPSAAYRFRKFARRNRGALAVVAFGVAAVLIGVAGLIANNWAVTREKKKTDDALDSALKEKIRADQNLERARKAVRDYLAAIANDPRLKAADLNALRKNLLATAVPFFEEFAAGSPDDPEAEAERAQAIFQLAFVREELGEIEKARAEYDRSRGIFAALAAAHPSVHKYRESQAISTYNLANVLDELQRPAEARAAYADAQDVLERLRAEDDQPEYRKNLASVFLNLGTLHSGQKNHTEGGEAFRKAIEILEKLEADEPAKREYLLTLATAQGNQANSLYERREYPASLDLYRKAIATKTRLLALDPANRDYRDTLAHSKNNLGNLLDSRGEHKEADAAYREARELWAQLAADFRSMPEYRHRVAQSYYNWGKLLQRQNEPVKAIAAYRQAVGILDSLRKDFPRNPLYREHLGLNANTLGLLLLDTDEPTEAETALKTAVAVEETLAADFPDNASYAVTLGGNYVNTGLAIVQSGRAELALAWYGKAVAVLKPLAARDPVPANAVWFLRNAHSSRAEAFAGLKKWPEALADWDRAIELSPAPQKWRYRLGRMDSLIQSGDHARAVSEADSAAASAAANAALVYDAACIHALASAAVEKDKDLSQRYAVRAIELLRAAVAKGYSDRAHMSQDPDLKSLREREEFKKIVSELKLKAKK